MTTNILASATSLSDRDLLARLPRLAASERQASAELVAHLIALDLRPDVYAAAGHGSLFAYCTRVLRLSEDAACTLLAAVSACRRFPALLGLLATGDLTLTAVRRLGGYLTVENYERVVTRAKHATKAHIDALVAELNPQPDAAPSVRKLPVRAAAKPPASPAQARVPGGAPEAGGAASAVLSPPLALSASTAAAMSRPVVQASAPERYRVQFTIGREPTRSCAGPRPCCAARSRAGIPASSSNGRSICCWRGSRGRS